MKRSKRWINNTKKICKIISKLIMMKILFHSRLHYLHKKKNESIIYLVLSGLSIGFGLFSLSLSLSNNGFGLDFLASKAFSFLASWIFDSRLNLAMLDANDVFIDERLSAEMFDWFNELVKFNWFVLLNKLKLFVKLVLLIILAVYYPI